MTVSVCIRSCAQRAAELRNSMHTKRPRGLYNCEGRERLSDGCAYGAKAYVVSVIIYDPALLLLR